MTIKRDGVLKRKNKRQAIPSAVKKVVRDSVLKRKNKRQAIPSAAKKMVWDNYYGAEKGTGLCHCCRRTVISKSSFHAGHVKPVANGGENKINNLRPICQNCNSSMSNTNMNTFIKKYGFWEKNKNNGNFHNEINSILSKKLKQLQKLLKKINELNLF